MHDGVAVFDCDGDMVCDGGHSWNTTFVIYDSTNWLPVLPANPSHAVPSPRDGCASRADSRSSVLPKVAEPEPIAAVHATYERLSAAGQNDTVACKMTPGAAATFPPNVPASDRGQLASLETDVVRSPEGEAAALVVIVPWPTL